MIKIGESVGLKETDIQKMYETDEFVEAVRLDQYESQQVGVQGVPFFVFNNKYAVSGAQPADVFKEILEKVWEEEKPVAIQ